MMIGDEHLDAKCIGGEHAFERSDAVVDRDQEVGAALRGDLYDLWRESVAELETVGYEVFDVRAETAQREHTDCASGCAVTIVIADDEQALRLRDGIGQDHGEPIEVEHRLRWGEARERDVELVRGE